MDDVIAQTTCSVLLKVGVASGLGMLCRLLFSLDANLTSATSKCEGASIGVLSGLISLQVSTYWDSPERLACPESRALFCNRVSKKFFKFRITDIQNN